ncbi:MAG: ABC transporter ATP-binding protein [Dehalococcoidia bacterium]|jgi:iron(III) transport system ATP-binding protein|nr:ABC transporter ATP-binding protein [Dehalococcoidia bacterium]
MTEHPAPAVEARGLRRTFNGAVAVDDLSLEVAEGELFALLGPSGCGKTTALRIIAGFEPAEAGTLSLHGRLMVDRTTNVPPERRGVGMVFQDYALFPHMSVAENVAYGLDDGGQRALRTEEALALVGLTGLGRRGVHELSGGEQQRVALARALAPRPQLLLLDEPFSNLDPSLRSQVRTELRGVIERAGISALLVTHDQEEALSIAGSLAFMWKGRIDQVGRPDEVYREPATVHAARFIGDANIWSFPAEGGRVHTPLGDFAAPDGASHCAVVVRPEDLQVQAGGARGEVMQRQYYGHDQVLFVRLEGGTELRVRLAPHERLGGAGPIALGLRRDPLVLADDGPANRPDDGAADGPEDGSD